MILFVSEVTGGGSTGFMGFARLVREAGENVNYYEQTPQPTPARLAVEHCPHNPADMAAFQLFKQQATPPAQYSFKYGKRPEELQNSALQWYGHYWREFESQIYSAGLDTVVVWGSGIVGNRAAILAAEDLGLDVRVLEDGWFPYPKGWQDCPQDARSFIVSPGRAYYEYDRWPDVWQESYDSFEFDEERFEIYRESWLRSRVTKYTGTPRQRFNIDDEAELPEAWVNAEEGDRVVWAGQVHGDAALFWNCPDEATLSELQADAREKHVWYKGHPFTDNLSDPKGLRTLPRELNIHSFLADADRVLVLTSNVGLEATMFDTPAYIYGNPIYKAVPEDDRKGFVDWTLCCLQAHAMDPALFMRRLKGDYSV